MNDKGWRPRAGRRCDADRMFANHQPVTPTVKLKGCALPINSKHSHPLHRTPHPRTARRTIIDDEQGLAREDAGKGNLGCQRRIGCTSQDQTDKLKAAKKTEIPHETDSSHSP